MRFLLVLLCAFSIAACTTGTGDSKNDKKGGPGKPDPANGEFEAAVIGTWVTECASGTYNNQQVTWRHILDFTGGGRGSEVYNVFQDGACGGEPQAINAKTFSFKVTRFAEGSGEVAITVEGQTAAVAVSLINGTLTVNYPKDGTRQYQKVGTNTPTEPTDPTNPTNPNDFAAVAKGSWTSQCAQVNTDEARVSYLHKLTFIDGSNGSSVFTVFQTSMNCQGPSQDIPSNFTFTVNRFANGGGEVTVTENGETYQRDVTFKGNQMTVSDRKGTVTYTKVQ